MADTFALRLTLLVGVQVSVVAVNGTAAVAGNVTLLRSQVVVANSTVGPVRLLPQLISLTTAVVQDLVLPALNAFLSKGFFPLPSTPGAELADTTVAYRQGFFIVASNLVVTPPLIGPAHA